MNGANEKITDSMTIKEITTRMFTFYFGEYSFPNGDSDYQEDKKNNN